MANNQLSINKIVSILRDLAIRHQMVTDFGYGATYNIESRSEAMTFPYVWLDDIGSTIEVSTDNGYKSIYYQFDIYAMDKINKGDSNYDEVISDTHKIITDMMAEISQHKYYRDMGLSLMNDITMEPVLEATNDNVNGWKASVTLRQPFRMTACNVPIEPITGYTVSLTSNITEYRLIGATGPQGATGPAGANGATGATGAGANITVDNGLTKIGDNIQLGGVLIQNTTINGGSNAFVLGSPTSSIDSFYMKSDNNIDFVSTTGRLDINTDTVLITDSISSKGAQYAADYSTNFTPESLITKRYLTNYVATASSNVSAENGLTYSGGILKLGGALTENTSITGNLWQLYMNPKSFTVDTGSGDINLYANTGDVNMTSTGDTNIGGDGSLYFTTYTGASLYADAGDVNININNGNFNVNAIAGTVSLAGTVVNVNNSKIVNLVTASNPLDAVNLGQLSNTQKVSFGFGADGSGGTLLVGTPTYLVMDHSGTITQWDIVGNTAGTAIFDIWKSTNQTLPTVANTIVASAKPTVGSASYATSIGLTGWGVTYSAGDIYGFNIDSIAAFTKVNLSLRANKS